uniref:Putative ovule protein n=1 Tax=Solanum chacoense TaxID=4108 RepID=A0A0V0HXZ7_SOLCH
MAVNPSTPCSNILGILRATINNILINCIAIDLPHLNINDQKIHIMTKSKQPLLYPLNQSWIQTKRILPPIPLIPLDRLVERATSIYVMLPIPNTNPSSWVSKTTL